MELAHLSEAARRFGCPAGGEVGLLKTGHIHDSYIATRAPDERILLQRLNDFVFKDPALVMSNLRRVTDHLREKVATDSAASRDRRALRLIRTLDDSDYWRDPKGKIWRAFRYIESTTTFSNRPTLETIRATAAEFATFQDRLRDLKGVLPDTIPQFHDLDKRFKDFQNAVPGAEPVRLRRARNEMEMVAERGEEWSTLDRRRQAEIPQRLVHNDAKLDNVLFDAETLHPLCIVDLDTVMMGQVGNDFADLVRTMATSNPSDDQAGSFEREPLSAIIEGYLGVAHSFLTRPELMDLVDATKLMIFELAVRFVTDYLSGDIYFRTHYTEHNLDRCRKQLGLLESVIEIQPWMEREITRTAIEVGISRV